MSNDYDRKWAEQLEAGAEDDELLALAERLRRAGQTTRPTPSLAFQRQLRRDLMNQYAATPGRGASVWRWAGSLVAVAMLAVVVWLTWLSISSAGRPSFGGSPPPAYQLLGHTVSVAAPLDSTTNPPGDALSPDVTLVVDMRWSLPPETGEVMAFVHLLDTNGQVIAQADVPLQPVIEAAAEGQATATASLTVTAALAANAYELVTGLYDPTTGARLPLSSDGSTTTVRLGEVPVAQPIEAEESSGVSGETGVASETMIVLPEGAIYLEMHGYSTLEDLAAGEVLSLLGRWRIPPDVANGADLMAFLHLRDKTGVIVAQDDGQLTREDVEPHDAGEAWRFTLGFALPNDLPPGEYRLVTGLLGTDGQRLPVFDQVVGDEIVIGPVTIGRAQFTDAKLTVLDVTPAAGTSLSGAQPITFTVRLAYDGVTTPALLEVKVNEVMGASGRGVATAQVTLESTTGEITVPVVLHPAQEFNAPAALGLWLQIRANTGSPPEVIELPEEYRWRYTP